VCRWCKVRLFRRYPDGAITIMQMLDYIDFASICRSIDAVLVQLIRAYAQMVSDIVGRECFLWWQIRCKMSYLSGKSSAHNRSAEASSLGTSVVSQSGFANM
jgi:hypothetical protein